MEADSGWRMTDGKSARSARASSPATPYNLQPTALATVSDGRRTADGDRARRVARALLAASAVLALSACGNIEPWVKPYERQALADPIMALDPHPISSSYMHHVFEAREGARGAQGSAGGGCGCN